MSDVDEELDLDEVQHDAPGGRFITFEGGEGAGKSTQAGILANRLARAGHSVFATREPGGSPLAEEIREALLTGRVSDMGPFAEAILFSVARQDHVDRSIRGALMEGAWVVCDRFMDSTRAYQGAAGGVPRPAINALERLTIGGVLPDLTFILDLPVEEGLARASARAGDAAPDRFEGEDVALHQRVRKAFLDIAEEEPDRCIVIDARQPEAVIAEDIWEAVEVRLGP